LNIRKRYIFKKAAKGKNGEKKAFATEEKGKPHPYTVAYGQRTRKYFIMFFVLYLFTYKRPVRCKRDEKVPDIGSLQF
jgi:hypothetical protein